MPRQKKTYVNFRPIKAEESPVVRVWSSPKGLPMAYTFWPTSKSLEEPSLSGSSCPSCRVRRDTAAEHNASQAGW